MVEVLTGIMSGSNYASNIRKWSVDDESGLENGAANLGQVFIAVDPNCFVPGFEDRMSDLNGILRNLPPVCKDDSSNIFWTFFSTFKRFFTMWQVDEEKPVLVPGDPERAHMKKVVKDGGIQYLINQLNACDKLADMLNIPKLGSL